MDWAKVWKLAYKQLRKNSKLQVEHLIGMQIANSRQLKKLNEISQIADAATKINRANNDPREPGTIGAVKALVKRLEEVQNILAASQAREGAMREKTSAAFGLLDSLKVQDWQHRECPRTGDCDLPGDRCDDEECPGPCCERHGHRDACPECECARGAILGAIQHLGAPESQSAPVKDTLKDTLKPGVPYESQSAAPGSGCRNLTPAEAEEFDAILSAQCQPSVSPAEERRTPEQARTAEAMRRVADRREQHRAPAEERRGGGER